jgi:2-polyprenyl-3-methyl-5-hydroxy-6-metoxy-1,4-benzoquinol methylase
MICPVCGLNSSGDFLFREQVPVHQNLLMRDQAAAIDIPRGDLALAACNDCGFIFNRAFDQRKIMYGEDYENTQACSPSFNEYLDGLVTHMIVEQNVRDCHVVEVGCGNGLFLRKLVAYDGAGNRGHGFDPSYRGAESELDGRLKFSTRYYDSECADVPADVIVCRHVIEHVPHPIRMLDDIKKALARAPKARIFFETPCVEWILGNLVVWDFFYEHCSYFSAASLATAFQAAGFDVQSVEHVFEGQYLWLEATLPKTTPFINRRPGTLVAQAQRFARSETKLKEDWGRKIGALAEKGKVALWGAGAKGVTFANLIDGSRQLLDCVVDLNPLKQGHYVPGTGHPIVGYQALTARGVSTAILMNPNYREENLAFLRADQAEVRLIDQL